MKITIELRDYMFGTYNRVYEALTKRGFQGYTAHLFAMVYCEMHYVPVEVVSEAVIETFGPNLLHGMDNIRHFAQVLKSRDMGFRAEQLLKEYNKLLEPVIQAHAKNHNMVEVDTEHDNNRNLLNIAAGALNQINNIGTRAAV